MRRTNLLLVTSMILLGSPVVAPAAGTLRTPHGEALEIVSHRVDVVIDHQVARTTVTQVFRNASNVIKEAVYVFPLPEAASVADFWMETEAQRRRAVVVEKQRARQIYDSIVATKRDPALLEQIGRRTFKMSVFPVPAHGTQTIELVYDEVVPVEGGVCRYVYPLAIDDAHASRVEGDFTLTARIRSSDPIVSVHSKTHDVDVIEKQDGVVVGLEEIRGRLDRDFELRYTQRATRLGLTVAAERTGKGDGTYLALLTPGMDAADRVLAKDVVLVMDTSGSMKGAKIATAKTAMRSFIAALRPGDRFDIHTFSSDVVPMFGRLTRIDDESRRRALAYIDDVEAVGGTAIDAALQIALRDAAATPAVPEEVRPLRVIFVTDGVPTVGARDPKTIIANALAANRGARIFAFGVESEIDGVLLNLLAAKTGGSAERVHAGAQLDAKVSDLLARVSEPVFSDLSVSVDGAGAHGLFPKKPGDLFAGGQVQLVGRYREPGPLTIEVSGTYGGEVVKIAATFDLPVAAAGSGAIERLWAKRRIEFLQDEIWWHGEAEELKHEIIELSRAHRVLTPYTSMLILETDDDYRRFGLEPPPRKQAVASAETNAMGGDPVAWTEDAGLSGRIDPTESGEGGLGGASMPGPPPARVFGSRDGLASAGGGGAAAPTTPGGSGPGRGPVTGGSTGSPSGPMTPGAGPGSPSSATGSGASGFLTGSGKTKAAATPGKGLGMKNKPSEGLEAWHFWWEHNQDRWLADLRARVDDGPSFGPLRPRAGPTKRPPPPSREVDPEIVPTLRRALASDDAGVAAAAALALGRCARADAASAVRDDLIEALDDSDVMLQRAAILGLGALRDEAAAPVLIEILRGSTEERTATTERGPIPGMIRANAALALGLIGSPAAIDPLVHTIRNEPNSEIDLRSAAILALGLVESRQPEIVAFLLEQLDDRALDRSTRAQIPISLARLGAAAEAALPELLRLMVHRTSDARLEESCVIALGRLAEPTDGDGLEALYEKIERGRNAQARHFAFIALAEIGARAAAQDSEAHTVVLNRMHAFLLDQLTRPKIEAHRPWASLALAVLGREYDAHAHDRVKLTVAIQDEFDDSNSRSHKAAFAIALGLLTVSSAGERLYETLLTTEDDAFKGHLAVALGMMRYTNALETLRRLAIEEADPRLRAQVVTALGLFGVDADVPSRLEKRRKSTSSEEIDSLARAVGRSGVLGEVGALRALLDDETALPAARAAAGRALGAIGERSELPWNVRYAEGSNYRSIVPVVLELDENG